MPLDLPSYQMMTEANCLSCHSTQKTSIEQALQMAEAILQTKSTAHDK